MPHTSLMSRRWNNRAIFGLLWPLIVEQALIVAMGAFDTVMVSSVGEHAVSGVNIVDNINHLMIIAFTALSTGGSVVASQYIGRQDYGNSRLASRQLVYVAVLVSLVMGAAALILRRPIIRLIYGKIADDVMGAAMTYFFFTSLSYPFLALYTSGAALLRASGNSKTPMRISLLTNVLSVGGNVALIYGLGLGVFGAAVSTLASRAVAAAAIGVILYRGHASPVSIAGIFKPRIVGSMIKNIFNIGIPGALESSMFMVGRLLAQRIFVVFGTAAIAANAISGAIISLAFMTGNAFSIALMVIVGQCVGAGDYRAAKEQAAKIMKLSYLFLFVISSLILIFMEPLVGLFGISAEAGEMAMSFLRIAGVSMIVAWAMSFVLPSALRASGDVRYVMACAIISMWTVRVVAAYFFVFTLGLGPIGVHLAMAADFVLRGILYLARWKGGKWMEKRVIRD